MSINVFQKVYIRPETTFADTTGSFSDGYKVNHVEKFKLDGFVQQMVENPTIREGFEDLGEPAIKGLKEAKFDIMTLLSGATVSAGQVAADTLTQLLADFLGSNTITANGTVGDGANTSTTTVVYTNDAYNAGDLIMINGEVRRIDSISGTALTLDIPLSAAPGDGSTIFGIEFHKINESGVKSFGVGVESDDAEMVYYAKGAVTTGGFSVNIASGDYVKFGASMEAADFVRGSSLTPATSETPDNGVIVGNGGGVTISDGTTLIDLCPSEVSVNLGVQAEFIPSVTGLNGKCGFEIVPADSGIDVTAYQDATLSALEGLLEKRLAVVVQIGNQQGKIVGVYYPEATISAAPVPADIGSVLGVKVTLKAGAGILFRG